MKKYFLGIVTGLLVSGTAVLAANYLYSSNEVSYTPVDSSWNVGNVKEAIDNLKSTSGTALTDLKNTSIAKAVSANGNSLSSVINTLGGISNKGDLTKTINPGGSVNIAAGYYSGGKISANANQNSDTYTPTSRSASLDMGANNTYRYINTNSVPNVLQNFIHILTSNNDGQIGCYYTSSSVQAKTDGTVRFGIVANAPTASSAITTHSMEIYKIANGITTQLTYIAVPTNNEYHYNTGVVNVNKGDIIFYKLCATSYGMSAKSYSFMATP